VILLPATIAGILVAWALGARLSALAEVRLRGDALVFVALAVQVVIFTPLGAALPGLLQRPLHVASYLLLTAFLLLNWRRHGFWLVGVGALLNVLVIFVNGGRMPVSGAAWRAAGGNLDALETAGGANNNVFAGAHTHLGWLGDVFALPPGVPLANALSIGDVLIVLGMAVFVYRACTPRRAGTPWRDLLAPLHEPAFRRVLAGRTTSRLGDWLTMTAVVTWIYASTGSTAAVSAFLVLRMVSMTAGGIASAPLLDRVNGFTVLALVEAGRGVATLAALPAAVHGDVAPVIALVCLSGFLGAATSASAAALVPQVLPRRLLQQGNALHGVSRNVMMVVGAAAGGLFVARFGIGTALAVDFATFAASALLYRRFAGAVPVRAEGPSEAPAAPVSRRRLVRELTANRVAFGLVASFTLVTAAMGLLNSSLPRFFDHALGDDSAYGYALAAIGAGLLCGELVTGFVRRQSVARRSVALAFAAEAALALVLSQADVVSTAYLMLFLLGAADGTTEVVYDTLLQLHVPERMLAGTFALASAVMNVGQIAGLAAAPLVAGLATGEGALRITAAACLAGAAVAAVGLIGRIPEGEELLDGSPA
jgi:predicted MFS family arabinose efflux permease